MPVSDHCDGAPPCTDVEIQNGLGECADRLTPNVRACSGFHSTPGLSSRSEERADFASGTKRTSGNHFAGSGLNAVEGQNVVVRVGDQARSSKRPARQVRRPKAGRNEDLILCEVHALVFVNSGVSIIAEFDLGIPEEHVHIES